MLALSIKDNNFQTFFW